MSKELPEFIPEIHFGFLSGHHYIGTLDIERCKYLEITFKGTEWIIKVEYNGKVIEKHYKNQIGDLGLPEIMDTTNPLPD